jgi:guanylate kinase
MILFRVKAFTSIISHKSKVLHQCQSTLMMNSVTAGSSNVIQSVLICGPSGVGKGTLINRLLNDHPDCFALSVSRTSRKARPGEIHGVHYFFVDRSELEHDIKHGAYRYLETAEVHGNLYGTREDAVSSIHSQGKICVLDLDTVGAKSLKSLNFPMKTLFIAPPSIDHLAARLGSRGTESAEQKAVRLTNAKRELDYGLTPGNFESILVNDDLDEAYERLNLTLRSWFQSVLQTTAAAQKQNV